MDSEVQIMERMAILQDVLDTIDNKEIAQGNYVRFQELDAEVQDNVSLQSILPTIETKETCSTCALGAMFISYVRLHNEVTVSDGSTFSFNPGIRFRERWRIVRKLKKFFSVEQLGLIELAFEGDISIYGLPTLSSADKEAALNFYHDSRKDHESSAQRLACILQNAIDNDGVFIPKECIQWKPK